MIKRPLRKARLRAGCIAAAIGMAAVATPAFATATLYGFDFTAPNSGSEGTMTSKTFTSTNGNVTATVTAWNLTPQTSGGTTTYKLTQATLGFYQGGLGVTSDANDNPTNSSGSGGVGSYNTHQIDNAGSTANTVSYDFIRVTFSTPVTLGSVMLNAFGTPNAALTNYDLDDDFSYGKGNVTLANNTTQNANFLASLFQTNVDSKQADGWNGQAGTNTGCQDVNGDGECQNNFSLSSQSSATAGTASQNWYIAASIAGNYGGDGKVDGFKLASANTYVVPVGAVPEPATWMTMILGFGAIGYGMRRRGRPSSLRYVA